MLPHWTENDILVDGVKFHYTRTGNGQKPALVLAHGFTDSGKCWLPVARDLEEEFDLILPDARAHGLSARVQPGEKVDMVADLAGLIRNLGLNRPIIGGHSMGAGVSAQVAASYPNLVSALILEDPAWRLQEPPKEKPGEGQPSRPDPFSPWLMSLQGKTIDELIDKCRHDNPTWAEVELQPWAESKTQFDLTFIQVQNTPPSDWQEVVKAIQCPTLLITADISKGAIIPPEVAQKAQSLNKLVQAVKVEGAGHNIRRENYSEYMRAVKEFLHARMA